MKAYGFLFWGVLLPALSFSACACSGEMAIQEIFGAGAEAPVFLGYKAVSSTEITLQFSLPVRVVSLYFDPPAEAEALNDGNLVRVNFAQSLTGGERITADILVEDGHKNTLNVLIPFRARNDRLPPVLINELRTERSKLQAEFVELRTEKAGNLGALRLFIASYSNKKPAFEFPPVEVKANEYIVIHLRTLEAGVVNETGTNLALSGGTDAPKDARDFWVPETGKLLHKTDAVYLLDQDDRVVDAIMMSEKPDTWGTKPEFALTAAELLSAQGAWLPLTAAGSGSVPGPADAAPTKNVGSALTRSVSRDETIGDHHRAGDWYVTAAGNITIGKKNSAVRF